MKSHLKLLSTSLIVALSFAASQASWGMENEEAKKKSPLYKNGPYKQAG